MSSRNRLARWPIAGTIALALGSSCAQAAVTIATAATKNIVCSSGVCTPNHKDAVLNVTDLQNLLTSGDVKVTTGAGALAPQVSDIVVNTTVTWTSARTLTLDAYNSITVNRTLAVAGTGGLAFVTDDGGSGGALSFGTKGNATFWSTSDSLTITGTAYTLVANIATLASDIAANASGNYGLANSYDASADGTYSAAPIQTEFQGNLAGLGNTISNMSISQTLVHGSNIGLFNSLDGAVTYLRLADVDIDGGGQACDCGALAGEAGAANIQGVSVTGTVRGASLAWVGGLVGFSGANIDGSYSTATIRGGSHSVAGGLVGVNDAGTIAVSYSGGRVSAGVASKVGGLAGQNGIQPNGGYINNSYATGSTSTNGGTSSVGGLVGDNQGSISDSYSAGAVSGGSESCLGGFLGDEENEGGISNSYWDTTTSGVASASQGACNVSNDSGITGMSTTQLQSGLPMGFDTSIWGENSGINGGLPYLLKLPPR